MGAPCWSLEEREYFVNVILPMSKYAGGSYSKPEGLGWGELAEIMQEELDRQGVSRRRYTSDMLFQHYYQKVSERSYKRGEGDNMIVPSSSPSPKSGRMNPPPRPTPNTRPATKKPSKNMIYASKSVQTQIFIEPDSESERDFQQYSRYDGPLTARYDAPVSRTSLEVQPNATSSKKRKYQATVDDARDDGDVDDYDFTLKDERFEIESPRFRKKKTLVDRVLRSETGGNRAGQEIFNNIDEATEPLPTRSQSSFRGDDRSNSPSSSIQSEGTSTIAWKTYTPTPSFEPPSSISDTSRPPRPSMIDALLEGRSRPLSRASDGDHFQVASPQRGSPRTLAADAVATRGTSNIIRSPGVGPSRNAYNDRRDSAISDFIRSPTYFSRRESSRYPGFRELSESTAINRHEYALPRGTSSIDDDYYSPSLPATPSGSAYYQGSSASKEDRYHGNEKGHVISPSSSTASRPVTPSLPTFRIRKRSKLEPSASFE